MATLSELDYFGTSWRSPQTSNQEQTCHDLKGKTERDPDNQDGSLDYPDCLASDLVTPVSQPCSVLLDDCAPDIEKCSPDVEKLSDLFPAHDEQSSLSMCSLVQLISGDTCTGNLFSFPGTNPVSVCHSTTSRLITDRDRRGPLKGVGVSGEHSVKGWKTSKRMKNPNQKLRMLSFSDIENCLNTPCSTLSDTTLAEISPDNLLHMSDHNEAGYSPWDEIAGGAGKRTKISHPSLQSSSSCGQALATCDIDGCLAADFDGSLSGLGSELSTSSYNMSEALSALPVFKHENVENGFQYVLGAATSPAVKMNEETLTYLNQGQPYEIKLRKVGDLTDFQGSCLRSVVKIHFHERRLQYMEKEQMEQWGKNRPRERILDVDVPLSYGLVDFNLDSNRINQVDIIWDPTQETGLFFKVNAISTEFTAKKHGGEKGVPFCIHVETYSHTDAQTNLLHAASCQIKVFKPKGADRKHKTDREKMGRRPDTEKEKYQASHMCTVLTEIPREPPSVLSASTVATPTIASSSSLSACFSELSCGAGCGGSLAVKVTVLAESSASSPPLNHAQHTQHEALYEAPSLVHPSPTLHHIHSLPSVGLQSHSPAAGDCQSLSAQHVLGDVSPDDVHTWLVFNRFSNYTCIFQNFSGEDLLRLTRSDLIQICGVADGIRLDNVLQSRSVRPNLVIYIGQEPESVYHAIYMTSHQVDELRSRLALLFGIQPALIGDILVHGPSAIHILVTEEVLQNMPDESRFIVEGEKATSSEKYQILLKSVK